MVRGIFSSRRGGVLDGELDVDGRNEAQRRLGLADAARPDDFNGRHLSQTRVALPLSLK